LRLTPSSHPAGNAAPWSATLGLAALLAFTATAWWRLGVAAAGGDAPAPVANAPRPAEVGAPATLPASSVPRLTIAADGSASIAGAAVKPDELAARIKPAGAATLELAIDPRAPGAAVDDLLTRLREAGVTRCTLVVEPPPAAKGAAP
jgi:hypothetical protein